MEIPPHTGAVAKHFGSQRSKASEDYWVSRIEYSEAQWYSAFQAMSLIVAVISKKVTSVIMRLRLNRQQFLHKTTSFTAP